MQILLRMLIAVSRSAISAAIGVAIALAATLDARADTPHKAFTPDVIVNPNAYYPEGPQLVDEGLLVAEMPRHRIVLLANSGERKTVWQADGCGPTSIKRIPDGGYWVLCHLAGYVAKLSPKTMTMVCIA